MTGKLGEGKESGYSGGEGGGRDTNDFVGDYPGPPWA